MLTGHPILILPARRPRSQCRTRPDKPWHRQFGTMPEIAHHKETNMLKRIGLLALGLAALGLAGHAASGADDKKKEEEKVETRVFELRTYYANPGKMKALHARFRDHTTKLFENHSMTIIGFWNPTDPKEADEKLIYILAYPSKDAADKSWKAFRDDPEWKKAKDESEKDGVLVKKVDSVYMNPKDYGNDPYSR